METLKLPQGELHLSRYPEDKHDLLRAWDAADEYLLSYLSEQIKAEAEPGQALKLLIVNDSFGALTTALASHQVTLWTDSYLAEKGTKLNLSSNHLPAENIKIIHSIETPGDTYDFVIIKIPKTLAMLEDQLARLRALVTTKTQIIGAAMAKAIHTSTLKLFEKYIGPTQTSLARKKARLVHCRLDENLALVNTPYPSSYILEGTEHKISNHANVFSRESLDIGTRFFLQHLPRNDRYQTIIDLACGNGVVGLMAAEKNPRAKLVFVDESYMAVASARENFISAFADSREASYQVTNSLEGISKDSADLVLNNPPFHQQHAVGDAVAWNMFRQANDVLRQHGELWVIGNRHLGYHVKLKKLFGNCETISSNKKFVILKAVK